MEAYAIFDALTVPPDAMDERRPTTAIEVTLRYEAWLRSLDKWLRQVEITKKPVGE